MAIQLTFCRGDFTNVQDGSGDSFFDGLLDQLGVDRSDDLDRVDITVEPDAFCVD